MSFSGKFNSFASSSGSQAGGVVPLSMSMSANSEHFVPDFHTVTKRSTAPPPQLASAGLAEELLMCRADLAAKEALIQKMKEQQEEQLVAIRKQLFDLECSLIKKEKEVRAALIQREKMIRQQSRIIRFLVKKNEVVDIQKLCEEARAKLPQIEVNNDGHRHQPPDSGDSCPQPMAESGSEHDSDSAIMIDDSTLNDRPDSDPGRCTSASSLASGRDLLHPDVPSSSSYLNYHDDDEDEDDASGFDTAHYRGFLLRNGSYERYKSGGRHHHHGDESSSQSLGQVSTLPRAKTNGKNGAHLHVLHKALSVRQPSSVVMLNTDQESFCPGRARTSTNHRHMSKPRDIKNRHSSNKSCKFQHPSSRQVQQLHNSHPLQQPATPFIQQNGTVFCSIYFNSQQSFA